MEVRILGPVDVVAGGLPKPVNGPRRKAVLAVLALRAGELVTTGQLAEQVWGEEQAPRNAANTLQVHVAHLRGILGREAIETRRPGYVLAATTDLQTVEHLVRQAKQATRPADAASFLHKALVLWRDRPLVDVHASPWLDRQADRLAQFELDAREALVDARLLLNEHVELVAELEQRVRQQPFHENVHRQLMLALYGAGRQVDALAVYQRMRQRLADELGVVPSPALRDLEARLLRHEVRHLEPNRFCRTRDGVRIAYHCGGAGRPLVVPASPVATLERASDDEQLRAFHAALMDHHWLVRYDGPDTGLSGPWPGVLTLDDEVEVLRTVLDALGLSRVSLFGVSKAALTATAFAARHPERVDRLVLYGGYADSGQVTELLDQVTAPTLVLDRRDDRMVPCELGEELATRLPDATFVPLAGSSHLPQVGDGQAVVRAVLRFLAR